MPRFGVHILVLLAFLASIGFSQGKSPTAQRAKKSGRAAQVFDAGSFQLSLPSSWKFNQLQGVDSYVGEFVGDGIRLTFDYGYYSNPLVGPDDLNHIVSYEVINGRTTKIVISKVAGRGITGAYVGDLRGGFPVLKFSISGENLTAEQQEVALSIMRTIKFK